MSDNVCVNCGLVKKAAHTEYCPCLNVIKWKDAQDVEHRHALALIKNPYADATNGKSPTYFQCFGHKDGKPCDKKYVKLQRLRSHVTSCTYLGPEGFKVGRAHTHVPSFSCLTFSSPGARLLSGRLLRGLGRLSLGRGPRRQRHQRRKPVSTSIVSASDAPFQPDVPMKSPEPSPAATPQKPRKGRRSDVSMRSIHSDSDDNGTASPPREVSSHSHR